MRRVEVFKHLVHGCRGHGPVGVLLSGAQPGRQGRSLLRGGDRRPQAALDGPAPASYWRRRPSVWL